MEPEGSLPYSQEPATCPYPEPYYFNPNHLKATCLNLLFYHIY
jgi:hypothetical protein